MTQPGLLLVFQNILKLLGGVEVRTPVKFFHTKLGKPFLPGAGFEHGRTGMRK